MWALLDLRAGLSQYPGILCLIRFPFWVKRMQGLRLHSVLFPLIVTRNVLGIFKLP